MSCPRKLKDCESLDLMESDCSKTFICCGISDPKSRNLEQDGYRMCFKSEETDTRYDYDEFDLLDTASVITRAIATKRRLDVSEKDKR